MAQMSQMTHLGFSVAVLIIQGFATTPLQKICLGKTLRITRVKGALDKYNIYFFTSCCKENFKISQYLKFQPIRPMRFHFIYVLIVSSPKCPIGHCIVYLLKSTSKNRNRYKYQYFSKSELN